MPDRRDPDRLERDINEILSNIEQFPDATQRKHRARHRIVEEITGRISAQQQALMRMLSGISLSQMMLASFLLILGSMFFREIVRISWPWVMYAGIFLFLTSFTLMVFGGSRVQRRGGQPKYWRGRQMPPGYGAPTLSQRLRQFWNRRKPR